MSTPGFHRLRSACDFYFVRHGQSHSNSEQRIQGHTESPLSPRGVEQANAAAEWFRPIGADRVFSSPLQRARDTAEPILLASGADTLEILPYLVELDTGIYTGKVFSDLPGLDEELFRAFRVRSWEVVPGAERIESLLRRAHAVWDVLLAHATAGRSRLVCVTHGGFIQWIVKATMGDRDPKWMPLVRTSNCGIFHFRAESTLRDPDSDPPTPNTGYYGQWMLIDHVPY